MNVDFVERLLLKSGEKPTPAHLQKLAANIASRQSLGGRNVRRKVFPWGTHEHYEGGGGTFVSPYFKPSIASAGDGAFDLSWQRGLIEGIEPTIGGVPISGDKQTGVIPKFRVVAGDFGDLGEALVYFRLHLRLDWSLETIEPWAAGETPNLQPWTADCLALILFADGSHWRKLVNSQGHLAINRRPNGFAQHLFWPRM